MNDAAPPLCERPQPVDRAPRVPLPEGTWDTHMHVFGPTERHPLDPRRNYTPRVCSLADYRAVMGACGIARAVIVQPSVYGTDNRLLLDALREGGDAFRGVAVPPADASDAELDEMHALGVRGIRLNLVNPQVLGTEQVLALAARVAPRGWHLQLQMQWGEGSAALLARLAERLDMPLVIDHMARPASLPVLPAALLDLLRSGRAWVKLSAPYRMSTDAPHADLLPLVHALAGANPRRLLWASDWPHSERFVATPHDADLVDLLPAWLPDPALRRLVCVDNPARLYGLERRSP